MRRFSQKLGVVAVGSGSAVQCINFLCKFNIFYVGQCQYVSFAEEINATITKRIFHGSSCKNFRLGPYFLPARRYASADNSDRNVSVRPSVTRRYCVETKKASGIISSPSGSPKTLVFRRQISSPNSKGFPPNGGFKEGSVEKFSDFFSFKRQYLENGSRYGQSYY